jgi:Na+-translocating ferredoxin:NAD+ oxidoreductase RnfD subunit
MRASRLIGYVRTPKGMLLIVLLALVALAYPADGRAALLRVGLAMASAVIVDLLFKNVRGTLALPDSAALTGLIAGMVLGPAVPLGVPILASAIAVTSKHVVRGRYGHVFNPAAVGLLLTGLLFSSEQSWWGGLGDMPAILIVAVVAGGLLVVRKVNKLSSVLTFLGVYFLLLTIGALTGNPVAFADAFREPETGAAVYFAFFMLTDPPTSPARLSDQALFAGIAACVAVACLAFNFGGVYALLIGLLAANAFEGARRAVGAGRRPARASQPGLSPASLG